MAHEPAPHAAPIVATPARSAREPLLVEQAPIQPSALERLPPPVQSLIGYTRSAWCWLRNHTWWALRWSKHWIIWSLRWTRHGVLRGVRAIKHPIRANPLLRPRLGQLLHHHPRPLRVPPRYINTQPPANPPRISIVTPSFNQAHLIERTIDSVLEQNYPNLEYIVQDGASTDGTRELLARFGERLHHWESAPDDGQTNAINRGFCHANGEIMAYLNSDDLLLPGTLAYVAQFFAEHPEIDAVYGHRILIDEQDQEIGRWVMPPHDDRVLSWADYIPQETLFWRRSAWERIGGAFDESFHFAMDWDFLLRLRDAGVKFARLPRFLGAFRIHHRQKTSASMTDLGAQEMARLRERSFGRVPSAEEVHLHVAPYLARHLLCHFCYKMGVARY